MFKGAVRLLGKGADRIAFFLIVSAKILISLDLRWGDLGEAAQNIETEWLICKILRNKELAVYSKQPCRRLCTGDPSPRRRKRRASG